MYYNKIRRKQFLPEEIISQLTYIDIIIYLRWVTQLCVRIKENTFYTCASLTRNSKIKQILFYYVGLPGHEQYASTMCYYNILQKLDKNSKQKYNPICKSWSSSLILISTSSASTFTNLKYFLISFQINLKVIYVILVPRIHLINGRSLAKADLTYRFYLQHQGQVQ